MELGNAISLRFHPVCGENIVLSNDRLIAERKPFSAGKALCFSDRAIADGDTFSAAIIGPADEAITLLIGISYGNPAEDSAIVCECDGLRELMSAEWGIDYKPDSVVQLNDQLLGTELSLRFWWHEDAFTEQLFLQMQIGNGGDTFWLPALHGLAFFLVIELAGDLKLMINTDDNSACSPVAVLTHNNVSAQCSLPNHIRAAFVDGQKSFADAISFAAGEPACRSALLKTSKCWQAVSIGLKTQVALEEHCLESLTVTEAELSDGLADASRFRQHAQQRELQCRSRLSECVDVFEAVDEHVDANQKCVTEARMQLQKARERRSSFVGKLHSIFSDALSRDIRQKEQLLAAEEAMLAAGLSAFSTALESIQSVVADMSSYDEMQQLLLEDREVLLTQIDDLRQSVRSKSELLTAVQDCRQTVERLLVPAEFASSSRLASNHRLAFDEITSAMRRLNPQQTAMLTGENLLIPKAPSKLVAAKEEEGVFMTNEFLFCSLAVVLLACILLVLSDDK